MSPLSSYFPLPEDKIYRPISVWPPIVYGSLWTGSSKVIPKLIIGENKKKLKGNEKRLAMKCTAVSKTGSVPDPFGLKRDCPRLLRFLPTLFQRP